jgi:hypothetical protein
MGGGLVSQSGAQTAAFFRDVMRTREVWTVRDEEGFPAPKTPDGPRTQPFWSSERRVRRIVSMVPAYAGFQPHRIPLEEWRQRWVADFERDGLLMGINWSGPRVIGWDFKPHEVVARLDAAEREAAASDHGLS